MRTAPFAFVCVVIVLLALAVSAAEPKTYRVGAASVVITPKVAEDAPPIWLAGYGIGRRATTVHDDIYARTIIIHDGTFGLAVVTCDLVGLFYGEVLQIREQVDALGLTPKLDYIVVASTHTHAGPDTIGVWGPLGRTGLTPGYLAKVRSACVESVRKAHAGLKRATLRIATADANERVGLIDDSRKPRVIDSKVTVIQATDTSGKVIVTFVNVPNHPEVLGSKNTKLSSDFPSTMRESVEKTFGGLAIYNTGSVGGLMTPRTPKVDPYTKAPMPTDPYEKMMAYGRIMGCIAEDALKRAKPLAGSVSVKTEVVQFPVWNHIYRAAMGMGMFNRRVYHADGQPIVIPKTMEASRAAVVSQVKDPHLKTEVGLIQIGPLQIATIPGEIYPEITLGKYQRPQEPNADFQGAPLEPAIFPLMTGTYKMVMGLANDEVGYIIPKSQWDWYLPYAYGRSERQYGEVNSCGPDVAPVLMAAWAKLISGK